ALPLETCDGLPHSSRHAVGREVGYPHVTDRRAAALRNAEGDHADLVRHDVDRLERPASQRSAVRARHRGTGVEHREARKVAVLLPYVVDARGTHVHGVVVADLVVHLLEKLVESFFGADSTHALAVLITDLVPVDGPLGQVP